MEKAMMHVKRMSGGCGALVLCAGAALVLAQGVALAQPGERGRGGPGPRERDVLRGPEVEHVEVPGGRGGFMDEEMRGPRERGQAVPHMLFMGALRSLESPELPSDVRATAGQREKIEGILRGFEEERRAFMAEHREELQAMRRGAGGRGEEGRPGERERDRERVQRGERPEVSPEMRERAQALREMAPKPEATHRAIFEVLNEKQREHVHAEIERMRGEFQGRMQRAPEGPEGRRAPEGRPEGRPGMQEGERERGPEARGGERQRGQGDREARMRRIQERINELPPEQRERVLEAIERMLERGERGRQRPEPGSMRDVDVPA